LPGAAHRALPRLRLTPRWCLGFFIYLMALVAVVAGRGFTLARMLGGRYTIASLVYDVATFGMVLAGLRLFDRPVKAALSGVGAPGARRGRVVATAIHATIMVVVGFPFILVTLQLHPLRIAPGGTPAGVGLPYTEVRVPSDGLTLSVWHVPAQRPDRPVVLVAHGFNANKENFLVPAVMLHQEDYEVVLFDFRA